MKSEPCGCDEAVGFNHSAGSVQCRRCGESWTIKRTIAGMPAVRVPRPERRTPEPFPLVKRLRLEIGAPETEAMLELEKLANKWRVRSEFQVFARKAIKGEI